MTAVDGAAGADQPWRLVFEVAVRHAYYAPGPCAGLRWSLPARSRHRLQRAGCVMRETAEGVAVYAESHRLDALQALASDAHEPFELLLLAHSADRDFAAATAGPGRGRALHLYDSTRARPPRPDGWFRLYRAARPQPLAGAGAGAEDAWALLRGLTLAERQRPPALALRMRLQGGAGDAAAWAAQALGRRWRLALFSRATYWQYLLPPEWASLQPRVVDLEGSVAFDDPVPEPLPDGHGALAACSRRAIALQRRPAQQFQLQAQAPQGDPVLVRRLPAPVPGALSRVQVNGMPRLLSPIYVNR